MNEGGLFAKQIVRRFAARKPRRTILMKPEIIFKVSANDGPCYVLRDGVLCECEQIEMPYFNSIGDNGPIYINTIINVGA